MDGHIEIARSYMPVEAYRYAIFMAKPISSSHTEDIDREDQIWGIL
jgi:hypothetical protein